MPRRTQSIGIVVLLSLLATTQAGGPLLSTEPSSLNFTAVDGEEGLTTEGLTILFSGGAATEWTASTDVPWLTVAPSAGSGSGDVIVTANTAGMIPGTAHASVTIDAPGAANPSVQVPVAVTVFPATCRGLFFAGEVVRADDACAVETGDEARLFHSITRLLRIIEEQEYGPDLAVFTDSFKEMLDQFGVPALGRSLFDFTAEFPEPLPSNSPTGEEIQEFLRTVVSPELTGAIDELGPIAPTFSTVLTIEEVRALGSSSPEPIEIDLGDVRFLEAGLGAAKGALLGFLLAYDLDLDIDALSLLEPIMLQQNVIDPYPSLFTLLPGGAESLSQSRTAFEEAIDAYFEASDFIRFYDDVLQSDDLITLDPLDMLEEENQRRTLAEVRCSLHGLPALVGDPLVLGGLSCAGSGNPMVGGESVDLDQFFGEPFDVRSKLPRFSWHQRCQDYIDATWIDTDWPFPDPTFDGVLPDKTQEALVESMRLEPGIGVHAAFSTFFADPFYGDDQYGVLTNSAGSFGTPLEIRAHYFGSGIAFQVWNLWPEPPDEQFTICPDDGRYFQIVFQPYSEGAYLDTLFLETNDPDAPLVAIPLLGCTGPFDDCDDDGVVSPGDNCALDQNPGQEDTDEDGVGDACELDLQVNPASLLVTAVQGDPNPPGQDLTIGFTGDGAADWTATPGAAWLTVSPNNGSSATTVSVIVDTTGMIPGTAQANISVSAPDAPNSPIDVPVTVTLFSPTCRGLFFAGELARADEACALDSSDEARLFHALTRILLIVERQEDGPDPSVFTDSLKEMLDQFAVPSAGRSLSDFTAEFPDPLPVDSPTGADVQEFLRTVVLPELTGAIDDDLSTIAPTFTTVITTAELSALDFPATQAIEVDLGDIRIFQAGLGAAKGALMAFLLSYDLGFDIDAASLLDPLKLQQNIIDEYPVLLTLVPDGVALLGQARTTLDESIDAYFEASDFIRNFDDGVQSDDLITLDPLDMPAEEELRRRLAEIRCSLVGLPAASGDPLVIGGLACAGSGTPAIGNESVNLDPFFGDPFDMRDKLPQFYHHAQCGDYVETSMIEADLPFPDPTFGGVLPEMTQDYLIDSLDMQPRLEVYAAFGTFRASPWNTYTRGGFLTNQGDAISTPLEIREIYFATGNVFSVSQDYYYYGPMDHPFTVCADDGKPFYVRFYPQSAGGYTDTLFIESNDPDTPILAIPLFGCTGFSGDCDEDGHDDATDNCEFVSNPSQADANMNGIGDACELEVHASPPDVGFNVVAGEPNPPPVPLAISFTGRGAQDWTVATSDPWLTVSPASGASATDVDLFVDSTGMIPGTAQATVSITAPASPYPPLEVPVTVTVFPPGCRGLFFTGDFVRAHDACALDPSDEARLFHAITRLALIVYPLEDGPNPSVFTDSLKEMLDQFCITYTGQSLFNLTLEFPEQLPSDSPTGAEFQEFLRTVVLPELTGAIDDDLSLIPPSFSTFITTEELTALGLPNTEVIEIDLGDVRAFEAGLGGLKGAVLVFLLANDLDVDIDVVSLLDPLRIQQGLIDSYPDLLTLLPDGVALLDQARTAFHAAIDSYFEASDFIRNFDDVDQSDDLLTLEPLDLPEEEELRRTLAEVRCSLAGEPALGGDALVLGGLGCAPGGAPMIGDEPVDLGRFFDEPFAWRYKLPPISYDQDCGNYIAAGDPLWDPPFPDPTFNGLFPAMTQERWIEKLGIRPSIGSWNFGSWYYTSPGGTAWSSMLLLNENSTFGMPLEIRDLYLLDASYFAISGLPYGFPHDPITICAEGEFWIGLTFSPAEQGGKIDTIIVESNDPDRPVYAIPLRGCTGSPTDCDNDGEPDPTDNCPLIYNPGQEDINANGFGDLCDGTDSDADGVLDDGDFSGYWDDLRCSSNQADGCDDNCPWTPNLDQTDTDFDFIGDACDNCPETYNPDQGEACHRFGINFAPSTSADLPEFYKDSGAPFSALQGYGWETIVPIPTRDRGTSLADQYDTFAFTTNPKRWSVELPPADYLLDVVSGDPQFPQGPHCVRVAGTPVIDAVSTAPTTSPWEFATGEVVVPVRTGRLVLEVGCAPPAQSLTMLNFVEIEPLEPNLAFIGAISFQPETSLPAVGFETDHGAVFDLDLNRGWDAPVLARERGQELPQVLDTLVFSSAVRTWEGGLHFGNFRVWISVGDAQYAQGPHRVVVEGVTVVDNETTEPGEFIERAVNVNIQDGALTIAIGGGGGITALNYFSVDEELDGDEDGIGDFSDNCPRLHNPGQWDSDHDGFGDACDRCPQGAANDLDDDDVCALQDNCPEVWNPDQIDADQDGAGDACDCAPNDPTTHPGADEINDGMDNQCPGSPGYGAFDENTGESGFSSRDEYFWDPQFGAIHYEVARADSPSFSSGCMLVPTDGTRLIDSQLPDANALFFYLNRATLPFAGSWGQDSTGYERTICSQSVRFVNFQPENSAVPLGHDADWGAAYDAGRGYGWTVSRVGTTRERAVQPDQRKDTLLFVGGVAAEWELDSAPGNYAVTVSVGDAVYGQRHWLSVEGVELLDGVLTAGGEFLRVTVRLPVHDGRLTLTVGGGSTHVTSINYVEVAAVAHLASVNFQPETSTPPLGWSPDSGRILDVRRGYGWQDDSLFTSGATRERNAVADQTLDTFVYATAQVKRWRLPVPAGDYRVELSAGDAAYAQGPHRVLVEGVPTIDSVSTTAGEFLSAEECVTVTDGELTLEIGGSAGHTMLNRVRVDSASCP